MDGPSSGFPLFTTAATRLCLLQAYIISVDTILDRRLTLLIDTLQQGQKVSFG